MAGDQAALLAGVVAAEVGELQEVPAVVKEQLGHALGTGHRVRSQPVGSAGIRARRYARVIGRLPRVLRDDLKTLTIHRGKKPFGGGNRDVLIHTGQAASYTADAKPFGGGSFLEEALVHEASHTSLDGDHAKAPGWLAAQDSDPTFISNYARDNPTREDVAESFLPWLHAASPTG